MLKNTNINKVEISHVLFNKVTLLTLTRRPSGHGIKNCQERFFIKVWTIHTQNVEEQEIASKDFLEMFGPHIHKMLNKRWVFDDSDETEITLSFYRSFSTIRNIFGGLCTRFSYLCHGHGLNLLKIVCYLKSKVIYSHNKIWK